MRSAPLELTPLTQCDMITKMSNHKKVIFAPHKFAAAQERKVKQQMIQDIAPHRYDNAFIPAQPTQNSPVFCFRDGQILLCSKSHPQLSLPQYQELPVPPTQLVFAFRLDEVPYFLALEPIFCEDSRFYYESQANLRQAVPQQLAFACAAAGSLHRWYLGNRFCGACGQPNKHSTKERALVCPHCGNILYPKICPAVIVAITAGNRLLLTRYAGRSYRRYALVAGYNEIGESIEQTVHREVLEETGLHVKNLHFYKSQPWVFSDSLLMGFFAELDGAAHITLQEDELSEAAWFPRAQLPPTPPGGSLTAEMIELFRQGKNP